MEESVIKYVVTQGPYAALFVWLLFTTKKEAREREQKLYDELSAHRTVIEKVTEKYDLIVERLDRLEDRFINRR